MATFQVQIEDLTGTVSDTTALSSWLTDGARSVLNILPVNKLDRIASNENFTDSIDIESKKVLTVVRKDASNSNLYMPCRQLSASFMGRVLDSSYMEYASTSDPAYIVHNDVLNTYPQSVASSDSRVVFINAGITVAFGDSAIANFPDEAENAVVLYAARNSLNRLMNGMNAISALTVSVSAPSAPSLATVSYSAASNADASASSVGAITVASVSKSDISGDVPAYTKPDITARVSFEDFFNGSEDLNPFGDSDPGVFSTSTPPSLSTASFSTPAVGDVTVASFGTAPAYTAPVVTGDTQEITGSIVAGAIGTSGDFLNFQHWYDVLADMIETEEDTELAQAQLGKIQSYIQAYQSAMQNQLNVFNDANVEYQAAIQQKIEQARISARDAEQTASLLLQKEVQEYQAKISEYQAEVSKDVQTYVQKLDRYKTEVATAFQAWSTTEGFSLQQYQTDIQNELNEFNKENVRYQANVQAEVQKHNSDLQKAITQAQLDSADAQQEAQQATQVSLANKTQDQVLALQNAAQTMAAAIQNNDDLLQKFNSELGKYQSQVSDEVQEYNANLQKDVAKYQWYEKQYAMIDARYKEQIQTLQGAL
tara:strand:+ start:267 stop:2057 length:1791 start_codon:yes stop_codon:yes gene_type:complete